MDHLRTQVVISHDKNLTSRETSDYDLHIKTSQIDRHRIKQIDRLDCITDLFKFIRRNQCCRCICSWLPFSILSYRWEPSFRFETTHPPLHWITKNVNQTSTTQKLVLTWRWSKISSDFYPFDKAVILVSNKLKMAVWQYTYLLRAIRYIVYINIFPIKYLTKTFAWTFFS